ncbi:MAG: hypothetical protein OSB03_15515 [Vicinamibacterales bacterium]|nr:hypothetical protein [Vicinamibacterales bacterium]
MCDRLGETAISTIDAFCLSLLREFPLEADLDPAFGMADETEVPRLVPQPHHRRQCSRYVDAARNLFPEAEVDGCVVYL